MRHEGVPIAERFAVNALSQIKWCSEQKVANSSIFDGEKAIADLVRVRKIGTNEFGKVTFGERLSRNAI